jgi:hypothetical protein
MSLKLLEQLKSESFAVAVGFLLPSPALRHVLKHQSEVQEIEDALNAGAMSDETIRAFVSRCMSELRRGERFPYDLALAALAVVLEYRPTVFAEEYLHDLSRLKLAEMGSSIRVAQECLRHRAAMIDNKISHFHFRSPPLRTVGNGTLGTGDEWQSEMRNAVITEFYHSEIA